MIDRRSFLLSSAAVLAAPAIVRIASIMPVSMIEQPLMFQGVPIEYDPVFRWVKPERVLVDFTWKGNWSSAYVDMFNGDPIPTTCPHTQAAIDHWLKTRT